MAAQLFTHPRIGPASLAGALRTHLGKLIIHPETPVVALATAAALLDCKVKWDAQARCIRLVPVWDSGSTTQEKDHA